MQRPAWRKALHDGWVEGTAFTPKSGTANAGAAPAPTAPSSGALEIVFKHDPSLYDGRYANVGWLQELPKQVTSMSWDNAALMSLVTLEKLKIAENEAVELELDGRKVIAPVLAVPGHPDDVVTVYSRLRPQRCGAGRLGCGLQRLPAPGTRCADCGFGREGDSRQGNV